MTTSVRVATHSSWRRYAVAVLALASCFGAGWSIYRFYIQELPYYLSGTAERERRRRDAGIEESLQRLRTLGAGVCRFRQPESCLRGLYIDLSQWHGTKSDFNCLEALKYQTREPFFLSLKGTQLDDNEIHHLFELENLGYLDLTDTRVTNEGTTKLQRLLPKLTVIRSAQHRNELGQSPRTSWIRKLPGYLNAANAQKSDGRKGNAFPNPGPIPCKIEVLSGTTFLFFNRKCRLLGVAESDDKLVQTKAKKFTEMWFKSIGNYIGVYNASNPLQADDGTCLVWVRGYDCYMSCLNEELVRSGLARVDYTEWGDYEFLSVGKDEDPFENWREMLDEAATAASKGEPPRVLFSWPPKSDERRSPAVPSLHH